MKIEKDRIKKILIFKLCCLGDVLMMTPAINTIKDNFPDSEITLIASSWVKRITGYLKNIDSVITEDVFFEKSILKKSKGVIKLILTLRKHSFDMVFLGHRNNIFGLILFLSGIKYRLGFCQTKFINYCEPFDENIHEVKRYLNVLRSIGIEPEIKPLELKLKNPGIEIRKKYGIPEEKFIIGMFPFGGINPGTEMSIKRWDLKNYFELIKSIRKEYQSSIVILFEGTEKGEKFADKVSDDNVKIFNIDIDLISICKVFISGDTGALHIAAGLKVSTLALFGPSNPELVAPLNIEHDEKIVHKYIWKKPYCSPCYNPETVIDKANTKYWRDGHFICYTGTHICMKEISVEEVIDNLKNIASEIR